ncbi:MAG TPA: TIR domain-containing protein [Ktedonobacteraceae bacterium]
MTKQVAIVCSHCRQENRDNARFCSQCGRSLATLSTPPTSKPAPVEICLLYSQTDEDLKQSFLKHMAVLGRAERAIVWHDRDIQAGDDLNQQVDRRLASAPIILMLISADFIASDYCYSDKMEIAMKRQEKGEARVIPLIIRPVDWEETPFHKLKALPTNLKPVSKWHCEDEAWLEIVQGIKAIL